MKSVLPVLLVAAINCDTAIALRESLIIEPHNEPELRVSMPSTHAPISVSGGSVGTESLGRFRWNTFYPKMLSAVKARNKLEMLNAYVATAREIMKNYPELKVWQRLQQYGCLQSQIELTRLRTRGCKDYSSALPVIAQVLGVPDACFPR